MTAKLVLFIGRRSDLTHEQFKARYESGHVPLVRSVLPLLRDYARNYLSPMPGGPEPVYDVVTEFWFDTMADLEQTVLWGTTEEGQILARDEAEFMDRSTMQCFIAEETRFIENPSSLSTVSN